MITAVVHINILGTWIDDGPHTFSAYSSFQEIPNVGDRVSLYGPEGLVEFEVEGIEFDLGSLRVTIHCNQRNIQSDGFNEAFAVLEEGFLTSPDVVKAVEEEASERVEFDIDDFRVTMRKNRSRRERLKRHLIGGVE